MGVLLVLLVIGIVFGLGFVVPPLLLVSAGSFLLWVAGFVYRRPGRRWWLW